MKLGILTFHYGSNYGGVLQCYALQQVLKSLGHDVYVINYIPHDGLKKFLLVLLNLIKKRDVESFKALCHFIFYHNKSRDVFRKFRENNLRMTKEENDINKFSDISFDAIFVGSDQVWNFSQQRFTTYFLGWLANNSVKKLSYAACCGKNIICESHRKDLVKQLSSFTKISVRSYETKCFINDILHIDVPIVADPTILYPFKEFVGLSNQKYILTYILTGDIKGGNENAINEIRKQYPALPVFSVVISDRHPQLCCWADKQLFDVSPDEWVKLIANCSFLYTDSFHGAVFAMKFGRSFIAYYNNDGSSRRFLDLQKTYGLRNIVSSVDEIEEVIVKKLTNPKDLFNSVNDSIIKESFKFINESLM